MKKIKQEKQNSVAISSFIAHNSITIIAHPNARKNEILAWDNERQLLLVAIAAPAENNKANIEVIKLFSRLSHKSVKIIRGLTSKKKVLRFE